jgi:preprotein translocase subunit YajC
MIFFEAKAFADTTNTPQVSSMGTPPMPPSPPQMSPIMSTLPFVMIFGVIYFLMIRPQQKKAKEQELMVNTLQKGEEVITRSGIIGKIHGIADKFITLEVDHNVRIKIVKNQIDMVLRGEQKA